MRLHTGARHLRQTKTAQARRLVSVSAVDRNAASHRQAFNLTALLVHKTFRTRTQYADVMHQPMLREIFQGLRHAVALEVRGAGAVDHLEVAEVPRDHRLIRLRADAHHAIEAFAEQINPAIGAADFQFQVRVTLYELRQARHDQTPRENVRHVHPNAPGQRRLVLAEQALDLVHVREQILAALVQHQAVLRRLHLARGALQQTRAEQGFQRLHMFGHGRARQAKALAREGKTRQFADPDEGAQQFQFVHGPPIDCSA
ncbi:hypothetical protein D3C72_798730 [compost metagenome]